MLHYIHVILPLRFHLRMKDHLQYNLEIKKDKASFKHFMTRYQTLSLDFSWTSLNLTSFSYVTLTLMIFLVITLVGRFWPDILLILMFHLFMKHNQRK